MSARPVAAAAGDVPAILTALFVVLLAAKLGDELFKRLGQPGIVGEILAGRRPAVHRARRHVGPHHGPRPAAATAGARRLVIAASPGLSFGEPYVTGLLFGGLAVSPRSARFRTSTGGPFSASVIYLAFGIVGRGRDGGRSA